ncbi:hypothetical protein GQ457_10G012440 [Hibiscus cannabinus]
MASVSVTTDSPTLMLHILFLLCLNVAAKWKNFVFLSPSRNHLANDLKHFLAARTVVILGTKLALPAPVAGTTLLPPKYAPLSCFNTHGFTTSSFDSCMNMKFALHLEITLATSQTFSDLPNPLAFHDNKEKFIVERLVSTNLEKGTPYPFGALFKGSPRPPSPLACPPHIHLLILTQYPPPLPPRLCLIVEMVIHRHMGFVQTMNSSSVINSAHMDVMDGFAIDNNSVEISHLQSADGLILFYAASELKIKNFKTISWIVRHLFSIVAKSLRKNHLAGDPNFCLSEVGSILSILWGSMECKPIHWVSWETLCMLKAYNGLELINFKAKNQALQSK